MKVVLFCGGFGMRLRGFSESVPKPMVNIGYRPILWHLMKYYSHYGHKDFILCLGWQANVIKQYFLNYDECLTNDFVLEGGGQSVKLLHRDIDDWKITFVDTGSRASIGERLRAVRGLLEGEEEFLANYTDGLSDVRLPDLIQYHRKERAVATFVSVKPSHSFHAVECREDGRVESVTEINKADIWMNGGFFVFRHEVLDNLVAGEDLIDGTFQRLIDQAALCTYRHTGFWGCMDTYKEKQLLDETHAKGDAPWVVWETRDPDDGQASAAGPVDVAVGGSRPLRDKT